MYFANGECVAQTAAEKDLDRSRSCPLNRRKRVTRLEQEIKRCHLQHFRIVLPLQNEKITIVVIIKNMYNHHLLFKNSNKGIITTIISIFFTITSIPPSPVEETSIILKSEIKNS